jgi:probable addiction module antidote protein
METVKLKKEARVTRFMASETLKDKELIAKALWQCLVENDVEGFKEVLKAHLENLNKDEVVKESGLPRRTLFRMLSPAGNPTLKNISTIIHKLCA